MVVIGLGNPIGPRCTGVCPSVTVLPQTFVFFTGKTIRICLGEPVNVGKVPQLRTIHVLLFTATWLEVHPRVEPLGFFSAEPPMMCCMGCLHISTRARTQMSWGVRCVYVGVTPDLLYFDICTQLFACGRFRDSPVHGDRHQKSVCRIQICPACHDFCRQFCQ